MQEESKSNDVFICKDCGKDFESDTKLTMHSRFCKPNMSNPKSNNIVIGNRYSQNSNRVISSVKKNNTSNINHNDDFLICDICDSVFSLEQIEEYSHHVNTKTCINSESNTQSKQKDELSNNSNLYSDEEPEEPFHPQNHINHSPINIYSHVHYGPHNIAMDIDNDHDDSYEDHDEDDIEDDYDEGNNNPISSKILNSLYPDKYKQVSNGDNNCYICFETMKDGDDIIRLPCLHVYHLQEIVKWLKMNKYCPNCKCNIEEAMKNI